MKNGNEPINPLPSDIDSSKVECKGLTKREYFAIMAMQGYLAGQSGGLYSGNKIVQSSVEMADMLLKELEKPQL